MVFKLLCFEVTSVIWCSLHILFSELDFYQICRQTNDWQLRSTGRICSARMAVVTMATLHGMASAANVGEM